MDDDPCFNNMLDGIEEQRFNNMLDGIEEQRFNNMLDGIEEEYDKLIAEKAEEQRKEARFDGILTLALLGTIVVWAGYEIWSVL